MYSIQTTPGFIIDSRPYGEAGKMFHIFTREFGLVMATAQGIRLEKSKLRYHTQEYSFGMYSLVCGKELWRLTSATMSDKLEETLFSKETTVQKSQVRESHYGVVQGSNVLISRLALLLRRLLHGEEAHPELFDCVEGCVKFLKECPMITDEQLKTLESVTVLRIMRMLGYIGDDAILDDCLKSEQFSIELLDQSVGKRMIINQHINKALCESHL